VEFETILPRYGEAFLRLFFPSSCAGCSQILELEERGLCFTCRGNLKGLRLRPSEERIRVLLAHTDEGWALFRYEGLVKDLFHKIKFERRRDLLRVFHDEIASFLCRRTQSHAYDLIAPIPLDWRRRLDREFNQSGLLAEKVHEILGLPLRRGLLFKRRSSPPQSLLGREARRWNLVRAFCVSPFARIQGRSILLIDDIFTTGATVDEAAKTLKAAGATRVGHLALARTYAD